MKMRVSLYEVCWNDWCTEAEGFDEYRDQYLARMGVPHAVYVDVTSIVCRRACLSVCPRASVSPKPHVGSSPRFSRTRLGRPLTTSVVCRRACVSLHSDSCCSVVYERANRRRNNLGQVVHTHLPLSPSSTGQRTICPTAGKVWRCTSAPTDAV